MKIKNIVFDVGNVLVRWEPCEVINELFPEFEAKDFYQKMYPSWVDLNLGKFTENEAINHYHEIFEVSKERLSNFMLALKHHQKPIDGSIELLKKLQKLEVNLFSITDNIKEIMDYHRKFSDFPQYFKDIIVSADLGILKPDCRIYRYLLDKHKLNAHESVFIDDLMINVQGAIAVNMEAFQFTDSESCERKLMSLLER